jgi:hypothetical protein
MGEVLKVLGQRTPAATTQEALYTVPGSTVATVSSLLVCNQNNATVKFRVRIKVNGEADAAKQFIYYDAEIGKLDTFAATLGLTLGAGDVVAIYVDTANVSFNLFGVEVS